MRWIQAEPPRCWWRSGPCVLGAVSAQLREVGITLEMLVVEPERGYRDNGARSNTSHHALLDYA